MSETDIKASKLNDDKLDAINGGVVLKPDDGNNTGCYICICGNSDFKVIGLYDDGDSLIVQCKKCGLQSYGIIKN